MRTILFLSLFTLCFGHSRGQSVNSDNIKLNISKPLIFIFNSIEEITQGKEINNALEVKLKVKNKGYNVSASVNYIGLSQNNDLANHLALRLSSKTSWNATIVSNIVPLSATPALLFQQPAAGPNTVHYSFVYDVIMKPFTTFTTTGNYNFTITFTMTNL